MGSLGLGIKRGLSLAGYQIPAVPANIIKAMRIIHVVISIFLSLPAWHSRRLFPGSAILRLSSGVDCDSGWGVAFCMMGRDLGLGWGLVDDDDKGSSSSGSSKKARGRNEWVSQMGWREGIRVHRQAEWKRATLTPFFLFRFKFFSDSTNAYMYSIMCS